MYFKFTYTCILFWQLLIISHVERAAKKSPCLSKCSSDNDQLSPKEYKTLNVKDEHQLEHSLISYLVLVKKKVILCVLLLFMLQILYKFSNTTVSNSLFSLWSEWRGGWERSQGLNLLIQCMPCLLVTEISVFMSHIIIWLYDTRVTLLVRFNRARYNFWRARLQSDIWCMQSGCKLS